MIGPPNYIRVIIMGLGNEGEDSFFIENSEISLFEAFLALL